MNPEIKRHTHLPRDIVCSVDRIKQQHIRSLIREDLKHNGFAPVEMCLMNIVSFYYQFIHDTLYQECIFYAYYPISCFCFRSYFTCNVAGPLVHINYPHFEISIKMEIRKSPDES